jgi:hypothetical protein
MTIFDDLDAIPPTIVTVKPLISTAATDQAAVGPLFTALLAALTPVGESQQAISDARTAFSAAYDSIQTKLAADPASVVQADWDALDNAQDALDTAIQANVAANLAADPVRATHAAAVTAAATSKLAADTAMAAVASAHAAAQADYISNPFG